jgi:FAD/FMN-containing dehydrogenase
VADKHGVAALQIGTPTVYAGLTLGGVLATSAHGSGYMAASGIWDTLLEITWVDGTGKVGI